MEIKELMNGAVLTYIMQNLQSTATKFFLSSFTNRYIKNPVYEDHYSTFSDVLHDFWVNLPKLVSSLLDNYTEQLKVEAAFLADDSVEQIQFHLKGVLESWIDTYFLKLNKAGLQMEMEATCDKEFESMLSTLSETEQTPQEIIQAMLKRIVKQMVGVFKQKWEDQMKDPTAKASFEASYRAMIVELTNRLTGDAPDILTSLNIAVPAQPPALPQIPTTPLAQAAGNAQAATEMPRLPEMPRVMEVNREPEVSRAVEMPKLPEVPKTPILPSVPLHDPSSLAPPKPIVEAEKEEEEEEEDDDDGYVMMEPQPKRLTINSLTPTRNESPTPPPSVPAAPQKQPSMILPPFVPAVSQNQSSVTLPPPPPSIPAPSQNQSSVILPPSVPAAPSTLQVSMIEPPTRATSSRPSNSGITYTVSNTSQNPPVNAQATLHKPLHRPASLARPTSNRRISSS